MNRRNFLTKTALATSASAFSLGANANQSIKKTTSNSNTLRISGCSKIRLAMI